MVFKGSSTNDPLNYKIIDDAKRSGFVRARIDGLMVELEDSIKLDKQKKHTIEIVVDRIVLKSDIRKRLADSVETALNSSNGIVIALRRVNKGDDAYKEVCAALDLRGTKYDREADYIEEEVFFSQKNACPDCGISIPDLQPRLFSFNINGPSINKSIEFTKSLSNKSLVLPENIIIPRLCFLISLLKSINPDCKEGSPPLNVIPSIPYFSLASSTIFISLSIVIMCFGCNGCNSLLQQPIQFKLHP